MTVNDNRNKSAFTRYSSLVLLIVCISLVSLNLTGCIKQSATSTGKINVVTTSNIIADWVNKVGGDRVSVFSLLPVGSDPHTYQPGTADVARIGKARLIFSVGLNLEAQWLSKLLTNASVDSSRNIALGDFVDPILAAAGGEADELYDPHFWWDPIRVKLAIGIITDKLISVDPSGENTYRSNSTNYRQDLDSLDSRILQKTEHIPTQNRKIVTSHETMQYFSQRYGYKAVGSIFPGISTDREPSAAELSDLTLKIRELGVSTIFTEPIINDRLARTIADETGVKVIKLYTDSLGPKGSNADNYISMMDTDIELIYQALK